MAGEKLFIILVLIAAASVAVFLKKLTHAAGLVGLFLSIIIYYNSGIGGIAMLATFFVLGNLATSFKLRRKQAMGLAEVNKGKRDAGQVIANAGVASITAALVFIYPMHSEVFTLMIAAAFSSANADTLSSELGNIYGSRYYHILTFSPAQRGLNGVISLEGTLIGLLGSCIIAAVYVLFFDKDWSAVFLIIAAGTAGNLFDSILGATAERKGWIGNNAVNFLNTLIAALVVLVHYIIYQ